MDAVEQELYDSLCEELHDIKSYYADVRSAEERAWRTVSLTTCEEGCTVAEFQAALANAKALRIEKENVWDRINSVYVKLAKYQNDEDDYQAVENITSSPLAAGFDGRMPSTNCVFSQPVSAFTEALPAKN